MRRPPPTRDNQGVRNGKQSRLARDNLTLYDDAYVALAERLRLPLLIADEAIAGAPGLRCKVHLVAL